MGTLERELKRGTLELLLLRVLADEPTWGYELLHRLEERSAGRFGLKEGTLYPVLYRLEDAGLVAPEWEPQERESGRGAPRKVYHLTPAGSERVGELTEAWRSFADAVESVLTGKTPARGSEKETS